MKQHFNNGQEYLMVEVPPNSSNPGYMAGCLTIDVPQEDGKIKHHWLSDADDWIYTNWEGSEVVFLSNEATEEQAGEVVASIKCGYPERTVYCDYPGGSDWLDTSDFVETALESLRSLLSSHGMEGETLFLKRVK